jgi:single-stranded DNA-binding protein
MYGQGNAIKGNLTRDVETYATKTGKMMYNFTIAYNRGKDKPADFWDCKAFDLPDFIVEGLTKGAPVVVFYALTQDHWEDKQTGKPRNKTVLLCNEIVVMRQGAKSENAVQQTFGGTIQRPEAIPQAEIDQAINTEAWDDNAPPF